MEQSSPRAPTGHHGLTLSAAMAASTPYPRIGAMIIVATRRAWLSTESNEAPWIALPWVSKRLINTGLHRLCKTFSATKATTAPTNNPVNPEIVNPAKTSTEIPHSHRAARSSLPARSLTRWERLLAAPLSRCNTM